MKCQEFQSNLDGLARGALLEARTRDEAAAHEESCAVCASRLADERALTAGLRALAATMREKETPAHTESALLSAFRSHATSTTAATPSFVTTAAPSNVVSLSEHAGAKHWSWVKTVAVAAMAAAAVALFMLVPPYLSAPPPARQSASNNTRSAPVKTHDDTATNSQQSTTAHLSGVQDDSQPTDGAGARGLKDDEDVPSKTLSPRRNVVRAMNASLGGSSRGLASNRGATAETASANEITTEFIPLVQYAGFAQSEGGHLVRVELPRSALASFGIPVNADQAGGRVKADVLLGEDGTARAIRFVR